MKSKVPIIKQVGLVAAGCQPWNYNLVVGNGPRFAYCATLAVYIFEFDRHLGGYRLSAINAEHKKQILCIAWNNKNPDLIATASTENRICVYDIAKRRIVAQLTNCAKTPPICLDWVPTSTNNRKLSFTCAKGILRTWDTTTNAVEIEPRKEINPEKYEVKVFRWHHKIANKIAIGHSDGSLSLLSNAKKYRYALRAMEDEEDTWQDPVLSLSWDPLSDDYILVANKLSGIRLIDSDGCFLVTTFHLPSKAVSTFTMSWIHSAPGMFTTGDHESGVLRLWTVSQTTPLESFKIKQTGFNCLHVLDNNENLGGVMHGGIDQNQHRNNTNRSTTTDHSVPPASVVCAFNDGGVGLYNLQRRKWQFLREQNVHSESKLALWRCKERPTHGILFLVHCSLHEVAGHVETIFDCKFKPDNPRLLATASFDGTIKVWSVADLTTEKTSTGNEGVIYSLSWAPDDLGCLVCGTRRNGVFIWNLNKEKVIKRFSEHGTSAVYCVAWNQLDSHRIASCSEDTTCVVRSLNGNVLKTFHHPSPAYGCDWSLLNKDFLATGCEDGVVRIWDMARKDGKCKHKLCGHTEKIFHVRWNPLVEGQLASGSDDQSIRVWTQSVDGYTCTSVLEGHTSCVRGLCWSYEVPTLLLSGSWDGTIRLWNIATTVCLEIVRDHGADIYGLASHPMTPFTFASSSRDSTLRIWSLATLFSNLILRVAVGDSLQTIIKTPSHISSDLQLSGAFSQNILLELGNKSRPSESLMLRWFTELFNSSRSLENLWDLVCVARGMKESSLSEYYKNGILHLKHLTRYRMASAKSLEASNTGRAAVGSKSRDLVLENIAKSHLLLGNLREYCRLLIELGRWETAIALAPGVSVQYWKDLVERYTYLLRQEENHDSLAFLVSTGNVAGAVDFLGHRGELEDALLVSQSAAEGSTPSVPHHPSTNGVNSQNEEEDYRSLVASCTREMASHYFYNGDPCKAACCHLADDDIETAVNVLIRANELELALGVCKLFPQHCESGLKTTLVLLAHRLEGLGDSHLAIRLLKLLPIDTEPTWSSMHEACARSNVNGPEREDLHRQAGLPSPSECKQYAKAYINDNGTTAKAMHYYLLSDEPLHAVKIGLKLFNSRMNSSWDLNDPNFSELLPLFSIRSSALQSIQNTPQIFQILALSSFVGCLKAIRMKYNTIVVSLLEHAKAMTERFEMDSRDEDEFCLSVKTIDAQLASWKKFMATGKVNDKVEQLQSMAGVSNDNGCHGEVMVAGSHLPSHSDVNVSNLTGIKINGPAFHLNEEKSSLCSLNEAIMWAKVNQFSPIGTGERIYSL